MADQALKAEVLNRLKNVKGHISGIERMVEQEQPCGNILIQLSAIRASIEKIGIFILENNAVTCLGEDLAQKPEDMKKVEKIVKQMLSFLK